MSVANVEVIKILSNNECRKNSILPCKGFYFAVTYSVAVDSDLVGPSFKDRYSQLFVISSVFQARVKILFKNELWKDLCLK
jgi:hypothetical protein